MATAKASQGATAPAEPNEVKATKETPDITSMSLYAKLAAITDQIGAVAKGGKNREQHYEFIEYAAIAGELRPLFGKYNVICIPSMRERTETEVTNKSGGKGYHVVINFQFTFVNGDKPDEREAVDWTGEAIDYGDKATGKAATSALKAYLKAQFNISEKGEEDPDAVSPEVAETGTTRTSRPTGTTSTEPATTKQKALIRDKLEAAGIDKEDMQGHLIEHFNISEPEKMTKSQASEVIDALIGGN